MNTSIDIKNERNKIKILLRSKLVNAIINIGKGQMNGQTLLDVLCVANRQLKPNLLLTVIF